LWNPNPKRHVREWVLILNVPHRLEIMQRKDTEVKVKDEKEFSWSRRKTS
jgi:hypothetical protein